MGELIRLESLLPDYYDDVIDMHQLTKAEQPQLDDLHAKIELSQARLFVAAADSDGLGVFENMIGIVTTSGSTVESRRKVIMSRLLDRKPYTITYLKSVLSTLGGPASVSLDAANYELQVEVSLDQPNQTDELDRILTETVPVNMTVKSHNSIYADASGPAFFVGGVAAIDTVTLTNDWRSDASLNAEAHGGAAISFLERQQLTNDWQENQSITAAANGVAYATTTDTVTLTNDWRTDETSQASADGVAYATTVDTVKLTNDWHDSMQSTATAVPGEVLSGLTTITVKSE